MRTMEPTAASLRTALRDCPTCAPEELSDLAGRVLAQHVREHVEALGGVYDPVALRNDSRAIWEAALDDADQQPRAACWKFAERVLRIVTEPQRSRR